ncbi:MarR family winged helix-turn-helix transcriptional regulator [Nocardioides piscis]|uniref:Winged helix-turn-helix transcriptional regulator n=1 Tax=Nocardioides piscis TaxID=2714938 RepID=A0A6G7YC20_9ACTN|nr:MarR family winged helix-turn-helix transcriptional regulator [Nocardioides piscis]QIK74269.1 winged helix-turn-helix transcriptional regulator [Nocardioides piscis]
MSLPTPLLMFIVQRHAEQRIWAHLAENGFEMTPAQGRLAARVDEGGSRLTTLAEAAGVTKQTAGFLVDQLERAGYVERVPDPTDGRARLVRIASRGRAAQACAREMEQRIEAEFAEHLGPRRTRELRRALEALREVTDPYL